MNSDIIKESGLTGKDLSKVLHLMMGSIHAKGKDRRPEEDADIWESMFRISKAGALMGDADCMSTLADIYYGQKTVEAKACKNPLEEAVKWWKMAAEAGNGRSATSLGLLHLHKEIPGAGSHGVLEYDPAKALEYFKMAYENGDMKAGRHIGLCYRDGLGAEKDAAKAFEWFGIAAERGDSSSALFMADCILKGEGTEQNIPDAINRYSALVECKGHDVTTGAYALARIYYDGEYVPKDIGLAKMYFESVVRTATMKEQHLKEEAEKILGRMYLPLPEEVIDPETGAFEGFHMINMEHVDDDSDFMTNLVTMQEIEGIRIVPESATYIGININSRTKPEDIIAGFKSVGVFSDTITFQERMGRGNPTLLPPGPRRRTPGNWLWYMDKDSGRAKVLMSLQCMNAVGALDRFREPTGGTGCCMHDGVNSDKISSENNGRILYDTDMEMFYIPANVDTETIEYKDFFKYTDKEAPDFKANGGWIIWHAHDSEEGIIDMIGPCKFYTSGMYHYGPGENDYYHLMMAAVKAKPAN